MIDDFSTLLKLAKQSRMGICPIEVTTLPKEKVAEWVNEFGKLYRLAQANAQWVLYLLPYLDLKQLIPHFQQLLHLVGDFPELANELVQYQCVRQRIVQFKQLLTLLKKVEVLRITLPGFADVRALVRTVKNVEALSKIPLTNLSPSNLGQIFCYYADVQKRVKTNYLLMTEAQKAVATEPIPLWLPTKVHSLFKN